MDINYQNLHDFHQTLSTAFFNALAAQPPSEWERIAQRFGSTSEQNRYPFLGELDNMREWLGERIVRQLASHDYSIKNRLFELTMRADKTQMEDDAGGLISVYGPRAAIMGRSVAIQPDQLMMGEVLAKGHLHPCYDGQNFYDDSHPMAGGTTTNDMGGTGPAWYIFDTSRPLKPLIYQERQAPILVPRVRLDDPNVFMNREFLWGAERRNAGGYGLWQSSVRSRQDLTYDNVIAALAQMNTFTNDEGRNLGMNGNLLVVPLSLKYTARQLFEFQYTTAATSQNSMQENAAYKLIDWMTSVYAPQTAADVNALTA